MNISLGKDSFSGNKFSVEGSKHINVEGMSVAHQESPEFSLSSLDGSKVFIADAGKLRVTNIRTIAEPIAMLRVQSRLNAGSGVATVELR